MKISKAQGQTLDMLEYIEHRLFFSIAVWGIFFILFIWQRHYCNYWRAPRAYRKWLTDDVKHWILRSVFFFIWRDSPQRARASSFTRSLDHTQRRTTLGKTPLDEWLARRRDLYVTTHSIHKRHIHVPGGIRTHNPSKGAAVNLHLRPRGHWDRQ